MISYSLQNISFYQLRYFISVAKNVSFSKAADECRVSQTAISQQISNLEKTLGVTLFERDNRRVKLTGAGEIFYGNILAIMLSLENSFLEMERASLRSADEEEAPEQLIRVGYYGGAEQMFLTQAVQSYHRKVPDTAVFLDYIPPGQIIYSLEHDLIDLAFTSVLHKFNRSGKESQLLCQLPLDLVVPQDHPFAKRSSVSLREIESEHLVPLNGEDQKGNAALWRGRDIETVRSERFSAAIPYLATDMHNVILSVEAGLGVSFFPRGCKDFISTQSRVIFIPIQEPLPPLTIRCVWKSDQPHLQQFVTLFQEYISLIADAL